MNHQHRAILLTTLVVLVAVYLTSVRSHQTSAQQTGVDTGEIKVEVQPSMRAKLDAAKRILEGLTLEDHEMVGKAARQMKLYSLEAGWNVIQTKRYQFESEEFRRNCDSVAEAAAKKDTGRVAIGYIAMTVRCVECHDYMRKRAAETLQLDAN